MADIEAITTELENLTRDEKTVSAVFADPARKKDFLEKIKFIDDDVNATSNDENKLNAMVTDPEKRKAYIRKVKLLEPKESAAADRLEASLDAMAKGDASPIGQMPQQFANEWKTFCKQKDDFERAVEQKAAELKDRKHRARIKQGVLTGALAVAAGVASHFLTPLGLSGILATIGITAAGALVGQFVGYEIWIAPVRKDTESFRTESSEKLQTLDMQGQALVKSVDQMGKKLAENVMQPPKEQANGASPPGFVDKLKSEQKSASLSK